MFKTGLKDERGYYLFPENKTLKVRSERRAEYMIKQMDKSQNVKILEIGCGTGEFSKILADKTGSYVLGTDLSAVYINEANKRYIQSNLCYKVLDFNTPEDLTGFKFDYIVGNGILHHLVPELDKTLDNLKLLLNDNGKIIFLEPNLYNPYCYLIFNTTNYFRNWAKLEPHEMALTKKGILKKLKNHNYKDIKIEYKDFLLPIIPYFLIRPVTFIGGIIEKIPFVNKISQSIFISARI